MDRTAEMGVFVRVVDEGGFSAAARGLRLTPSAVSKQITRLEDRLGVRLLTRTTRQLHLTEEGSEFYERSVRILADLEEAEQAVSRADAAPRGTLRVSCGVSFGKYQISPLVSEFLTRYPDVTIELDTSDSLVDLVEEGIDVAVRFGPLSDSSMVARFLANSRRAIVAAPSYLARFGEPAHPRDLVHHNCLSFTHQVHLNEWRFKGPEGEIPVEARGNFKANNGETVFEMALAGLGIARLARFLVEPGIRAGRLKMVLQDYYRDINVPIHAIYPTRRHLSPKVRAFVDFLVEKYTPHPPWEN